MIEITTEATLWDTVCSLMKLVRDKNDNPGTLLSPKDQQDFIRSVLYKSKSIYSSKPFVILELQSTTEIFKDTIQAIENNKKPTKKELPATGTSS